MKIAFSGKICSGKSTSAVYIKFLDDRFEIYSFAGRLKELASELFGYTPDQKDRKILQDFGSLVRGLNQNAWINSLNARTQGKEYIIIDDIRMKNEYIALKEQGYIIIRLEISTDVQIERIKKQYPSNWETHVSRLNHETETGLDDAHFDYVINTDNLESVTNELRVVYNNLKLSHIL